MKQVSQKFKDAIKQYGRQIDVIITYTENGIEKLLDTNTLFAVTPITNGNLLKSVMKQLDFESSIKVPKDTIINFKFGVLIDFGLTVAEVNEMKVNRLNSLEVKNSASLPGFEYIDFGNYIVAEEPEYNADTLSYTHKCFDKMIYSMKDYESLNVPYPITIKDYLSALATKIGLQLKQSTFYNENKDILNELYLDTNGNSLGYTYRDVLDEIAQATGSIICISNDDKLEVRYLSETNEIIDEEMLKDVNVGFKEQYGIINTIVLSRSAGADNIYYPDPLPQNPVEIKIQDNQIMNFNNRSEYLEGLYNALNGTNYYINDFKSTGICYLELGDKYNVKIGETTYNCVLLNDEIDITQGLEEQIFTEMPEQSVTDYKKADTTDNRIKKTILQVNKQEGKIEGIIEDIGDRSQKTTTITQDIDGIESLVQDIEDLTNTITANKTVTISDAYAGANILELHIYGNNRVFDYLYPRDDLYPADDLFPYGDSKIRFYNDNEDRTIELGIDDVLRANDEVQDEVFINNTEVYLIRRVAPNGTTKQHEEVTLLGNLTFVLQEGNNTFEIVNYSALISVKYATKNDFTDVFATKAEMSSSITQTATEINLEVSKKVDENEVISKINQSAEQISIEADKISLSGKALNLGEGMSIVSDNFNVDSEGNMTCRDAEFIGGDVTLYQEGQDTASLEIRTDRKFNPKYKMSIYDTGIFSTYYAEPIFDLGVANTMSGNLVGGYLNLWNLDANNNEPTVMLDGHDYGQITLMKNNHSTINLIGSDGRVICVTLVQTSLEKDKENFEKLQNALNIIKNTDIYKYNLKIEDDKNKKHIGFVIGDNYKYSHEITQTDKNGNEIGVDVYSMVSVAYKAIQEQQEQIEQLQQKIKELEEK